MSLVSDFFFASNLEEILAILLSPSSRSMEYKEQNT